MLLSSVQVLRSGLRKKSNLFPNRFVLTIAFEFFPSVWRNKARGSRDGKKIGEKKNQTRNADGVVYRLKLIACLKWRHNRREIYLNVKHEKRQQKPRLILIKFCCSASSQPPENLFSHGGIENMSSLRSRLFELPSWRSWITLVVCWGFFFARS